MSERERDEYPEGSGWLGWKLEWPGVVGCIALLLLLSMCGTAGRP